VIPDRGKKEVSAGTGNAHTFVVKTPRRKVRIVLQDSEGKALDGVAYRLVVGSAAFEGKVGSDGAIEHEIPVAENEGELTMNGQTFPIRVGHLNPIAGVDDGGLSGAHARLVNLGLASGPPGDETAVALRAFARARGLNPDAPLDEIAKKLETEHGC